MACPFPSISSPDISASAFRGIRRSFGSVFPIPKPSDVKPIESSKFSRANRRKNGVVSFENLKRLRRRGSKNAAVGINRDVIMPLGGIPRNDPSFSDSNNSTAAGLYPSREIHMSLCQDVKSVKRKEVSGVAPPSIFSDVSFFSNTNASTYCELN